MSERVRTIAARRPTTRAERVDARPCTCSTNWRYYGGERATRLWEEFQPIPTRRGVGARDQHGGFTGESTLLETLCASGLPRVRIDGELEVYRDGRGRHVLVAYASATVADRRRGRALLPGTSAGSTSEHVRATPREPSGSRSEQLYHGRHVGFMRGVGLTAAATPPINRSGWVWTLP